MKRAALALCAAVAALLGGCDERAYHNGIEARQWPAEGAPRYVLSVGADAQLALTDTRDQSVTPLPWMNRKFSAPLVERIRFSADGRRLFVPLRSQGPADAAPRYVLAVWDIAARRAVGERPLDAPPPGRP